jgi:uncharacterized membrane protein
VRWKLLLVVSLVGGLIGVTLWSIVAIGVFGSARVMAQEDWRLFGSLIIPIGVTVFASMFVYRHTSKRRKLQALLAGCLVIVTTGFWYFLASGLFVSRLYIPKTYEVRHAR